MSTLYNRRNSRPKSVDQVMTILLGRESEYTKFNKKSPTIRRMKKFARKLLNRITGKHPIEY